MDYKAKLLALLGLPATATDAEIEAALTSGGETMKKGAQYDATKNRLDTLLAAQIETDLDNLGLKGDARTAAKTAFTKNRDEALALFTALGKDGSGYARTHNRDTAKTPSSAAATTASAPADQARGARVSNRATELRAANPRLTRSQAFAKAEAEITP